MALLDHDLHLLISCIAALPQHFQYQTPKAGDGTVTCCSLIGTNKMHVNEPVSNSSRLDVLDEDPPAAASCGIQPDHAETQTTGHGTVQADQLSGTSLRACAYTQSQLDSFCVEQICEMVRVSRLYPPWQCQESSSGGRQMWVEMSRWCGGEGRRTACAGPSCWLD